MYCDGGTADTRTLLPNGQTVKKGASEGGKDGKGVPLKKTGGRGRGWSNRFNSTALEFPEASIGAVTGEGAGVDPVDFSEPTESWPQEQGCSAHVPYQSSS